MISTDKISSQQICDNVCRRGWNSGGLIFRVNRCLEHATARFSQVNQYKLMRSVCNMFWGIKVCSWLGFKQD